MSRSQTRRRGYWHEKAELLEVALFPCGVTLPDTVEPDCAYMHQKRCYGILFKTRGSVLQDLGSQSKVLGAKMGMLAHTTFTCGSEPESAPSFALYCFLEVALTANGKWKLMARTTENTFFR